MDKHVGWSKLQIGQDLAPQSIKTTRVRKPNNTPCNLRWVHNLNHLIKADPCTPNMWASPMYAISKIIEIYTK
jgi:hypothetical protein